ncbi:Caffeoylshikimate esterase [Camellia lanceoleosa]|uniref:Caffeoylshikimate esterase n=1 Tax=Camellia lanceoleosa TaxID=1840588 RepID=A0ACC0HUQ7_9ERIC|nr:Caffeoylshikimate esterase [Camellia lanceoleosa]
MICLSIQTFSIPRESHILIGFGGDLHVAKRKLSLNFNLKSKAVCVVPALGRVLGLNKSSSSTVSMPKQVLAASSVMLTSAASGRVNALFSLRMLYNLLLLINALVMLRSCCEKMKDDKHKQHSSSSSRRRGERLVRVPASVPWKSSAVDQEVAARRALAIQRVTHFIDDNSRRDFSLFVTPRGYTMFTQSWSPVSKEIRGVVVVLHGLNEHGDRYSEFAKELNTNGYKVYAMDWIGHGGSDGLHAYVHSLDDAVTDMNSFIRKVLAENPGLPCFCFGHSTGAAIVLKAVLEPKLETCIAGVVLTSPAVGIQPSHPIIMVLAPVFSFLFPRLQFSAANKQGIPVSRDPDALVAKYSDPLVYTGPIRMRTGYEILQITAYLQQNLRRLKVPFLVLHGTADTITDPEASKKLYEEASSTDKTIKLFEGFLHDLLFEPEREMIVKNIIDWLNIRRK